jgi:hypothetical protein
MMCGQVGFELRDGRIISGPELREEEEAVVIGVLISFHGDKTHAMDDQTHHYVDGANGTEAEKWLAGMLVEWVFLSEVEEEDPFFTRYLETGTRRVLIVKDMNRYLDIAAVEFGLKKGVFRGHSFRSGGASEMFQSGVIPEVVNHAGRWKFDSVASIRYRLRKDRVQGALSGVKDMQGNHGFKHMKSVRKLGTTSKVYKSGRVIKKALNNTTLVQNSYGGGRTVRVSASRIHGPIRSAINGDSRSDVFRCVKD